MAVRRSDLRLVVSNVTKNKKHSCVSSKASRSNLSISSRKNCNDLASKVARLRHARPVAAGVIERLVEGLLKQRG